MSILYIIIIIVSIYNLISFSSEKKERKKASKIEIESLKIKKKDSLSKITDKESVLLNDLFKKNFTDSEVINIKGIYHESILQSKYQNEKIQYIGNHQVIIFNKSSLEIGEEYEIKGALLEDKIYVLEIKKNNYNFEDKNTLDNNHTSVKNTDYISLVEDFEKINTLKSHRFLESDEQSFLTPISFIVFLGTMFSFIGSFSDYPSFVLKSVLITWGVILFAIFYQENNKKEIYSVEGNITKISEEEVSIDGIRIIAKKNWIDKIKVGSYITAEGTKLLKETAKLEAVKLGNFSNKEDNKKFNKNKVIFYSVIIIIYIILSLIAWNSNGYKHYREYLAIKNLKSTFKTYEDIKNYKFVVNQEVSFKNIKYFNDSQNPGQIFILEDKSLENEEINNKIKNWETKIDNLNEFLNKTPYFISSKKDKEYKKYKEYNEFLTLWKVNLASKKEITRSAKNFARVYLKDINEEIENNRLSQEKLINRNIVIRTTRDFSYDSHNKYELDYNMKIRKANVYSYLYGKRDTIKGIITNISKENGKLILDLDVFKNYDNIMENYKYKFIMIIYDILIAIMLALLVREVLKPKE